jgi:hypothetical protein
MSIFYLFLIVLVLCLVALLQFDSIIFFQTFQLQLHSKVIFSNVFKNLHIYFRINIQALMETLIRRFCRQSNYIFYK